MSNLLNLIQGQGVESNNSGGSDGRVTLFQNGTKEKPFIASSGQVTYRGGRREDTPIYLVDGHSIVLAYPGDEIHKAYLVNEEDKTSFDENAFLLLAVPLRFGPGSQNADVLRKRLLAGEGHVLAALAVKKTEGVNGEVRVRLVGEMAFNDGEIHPITILDPIPEEIAKAKSEGKGGYAFRIPLTQQMINSCRIKSEMPETQAAPSNPLARKKGTAIHKTPVAAATDEDIPF